MPMVIALLVVVMRRHDGAGARQQGKCPRLHVSVHLSLQVDMRGLLAPSLGTLAPTCDRQAMLLARDESGVKDP
jgi:hypothetical protein